MTYDKLRYLALCSSLFLNLTIGFAQQAVGTINGEVIDSSGAVIQGATVVATKVNTNVPRTTETNELGRYSLPAMQPGSYTVSVSRSGFRQSVAKDLKLDVDQVLTLNVTLEPGTVETAVDVIGTAALVEQESATVGQVLETRQIQELPLNGRNFLQLTTLGPGTLAGYARDVSRQGGTRSQSMFAIAVNGGRSEYTNILLDGVLDTDENFNTFILSPSVDDIEEFKVQTSNYSAQYGRGGAGQINVITKAGSNEVHGSAFDFLRNAAVDARNFFDLANQPIPPYKQNQFGATFGGPVNLPKLYKGRDRTFFFFSWESLRVRQAQTSIATVPTAAVRGGDFSGAGVTIYDPASTKADPSNPGQYLRTPFPNNVVPSSRFDPVSQNLLKYLPDANLPGSVNNYINNLGVITNNYQITGRIDQKLTNSNNLFGRYGISNEYSFNPGAFLGLGTTVQVRGQLVGLGDTWVISPTKVNQLTVGFNRFRNGLLLEHAYSTNIIAQAGIQGLTDSPADYGLPALSVAGITGWGDQSTSYPSLLRDQVLQAADNLSIIHGRHSINLGGEFRYFNFNNFADNFTRGSYNFVSPFYTSNPQSATKTGAGFADYLLGTPSFSEAAVGDASIYDVRKSYNLYIQDDIKATRKLAVNVGFRYELNPYPTEKYDRIESLDLSTAPWTIVRAGSGDPYFMYPGNIVLSGIPYVRDGRFGRSLLSTNWKDLGPRFGMAYALGKNTSIRGGYGIYYSQDIGNPFFDLARNVPRNTRASLNSDPIFPQLNMATVFYGLANGQGVLYPTLTMVDRRYPTPYIQQWSLNVQHEFGRDLVLEVGYTGAKGTDLGILNLLNDAPPAPGASQARRPDPAIARIFLIDHNTNSTYEAGQARLQKRYGRGLAFTASYTFGKSLDYASSTRTSDYNNRPMDPENRALDHGRSLFDARQNFVFSSVYQLPFGPGGTVFKRGGAAGKLVGGWQLAGILTLRTGLPFTVGASGDIANSGNDQSGRANLVPGQNPVVPPSQRSPNQWFNTAAYVVPPLYTYGNAGRNTLDGPGLRNLDLSVVKDTVLRERLRLQFRAESFNLSNTPPFGTPHNTVNGNSFGMITSAGSGRKIQFAMKLVF